ncbi:hypothetical protein CC1G_12129 [Coprinopsis cinerea okayama7|uniref:Ubiquinol-cytochrome c chaperone domain-containing protein n=1 Tax=Coprinopsis cinerea (strain Okayama-7 / 130 / ATCC MYA-4618 / FGSC 9003) TaxID=240176 RepID=A8PAZ3_COPC7|nr:hypothetical protein CC1G_12129 [Coprinopsis cinerea okayama7\|eukprot:XP_001840075.1 hypothetical protein CC1G_12129 [Coprinopsis cinerea okayama7\
MLPRSVLLRYIGASAAQRRAALHVQRRLLASSSSSSASSSSSPSTDNKTSQTKPPTKTTTAATQQEKSWLTKQVQASPVAKKVFLGLARVLGYGSPKQNAARRAFALYEEVCAVRADEDKEFWQQGCYLPPTFQSWFTITNLHIWMLTVRLRALPPEHGKHYIQALIDHFFLDIEDRIRDVLQPKEVPKPPYTFRSDFYINPNEVVTKEGVGKKVLARTPDRIVTRQMKIFKEQWAGMGLSLDLAMVEGDMEMAAAVWRNLLGARGAQGIEYPSPHPTSNPSPHPTSNPSPHPTPGSTSSMDSPVGSTSTDPPSGPTPRIRRAVNLVGGEVVNVSKIDLEKESTTDDGSGVHDFPPQEVDKYLAYPEVMCDLTRYIRRELKRLESVPDHEILRGDWTKLKFGNVYCRK